MYRNFLFRKSKEKLVSELVSITSERYYGMIKHISDGDMKLFFISIISEISNGIFDFYLDLNRTNNVFYTNVNKLSEKLIKEIYILNITFYTLKLFEIDDTINIDDFKKCVFNTFRFNKKEKKIFNKYFDLYAIDKESFTIDFVHSFSKKVFSTKEATRMEFIYIDHYLESSFNSFYSSFVTVIA